ncbi:MAG: hypothetical protein JRG95_02670 [Deltaproteobacteria bacterium]|nr:hypothetical protein [Deltaproteobacteria bacterium]
MHETRRVAGLLSVAMAAALFFSAASAGAECTGMRAFRGRIVKIEKAALTVQNQKDDKITFARAERGAIVDRRSGTEPASSWADLQKNMLVSVCWKFDDDPPRAHKIVVQDDAD